MRKFVSIPALALGLALAATPLPASYSRYLGDGEKALLNGRYSVAVRAFQKAARSRKTIRLYNDLFLAHAMLDEFEKARAAQNKAIALAKKVKKKGFRNLMLAEFYSGLMDLTILEEEVLHEKDFRSEEEADMFLKSGAYKSALQEVMSLYDKVLRYGRYENQIDDPDVQLIRERVVTDREDLTLQNLDLLREGVAEFFTDKGSGLPASLNDLARFKRWKGLPKVYPPRHPSNNRSRNYPGIYNDEAKAIRVKKIRNSRGWGYDPISGHIFVDLRDSDLEGNPWYQN